MRFEHHCGITLLSNVKLDGRSTAKFETPMELHCSQTQLYSVFCPDGFETPMELHCSQTILRSQGISIRLRPLWNYTALKLSWVDSSKYICLRPLWNYTALKLNWSQAFRGLSLRPLWNYTALKLNEFVMGILKSLRPLWNYTALKRL